MAVRPIFQWWGSQTHLDGLAVKTGDFIPGSPRLQVDLQAELPPLCEEVQSRHRVPSVSLTEDPRADPNDRRPLFDRHGKIRRHSHGKLGK